nr:hypothetical protein Iba_chr12bCG12500 [Ipomoea batatas]
MNDGLVTKRRWWIHLGQVYWHYGDENIKQRHSSFMSVLISNGVGKLTDLGTLNNPFQSFIDIWELKTVVDSSIRLSTFRGILACSQYLKKDSIKAILLWYDMDEKTGVETSLGDSRRCA